MRKWVVSMVVVMTPWLAKAAPPVAADGQVTTAQLFSAVLQDAGHRREVSQAALATPVWRHIACKAARYTQAPEVGVYAPVKFDSTGAPVAGEWREGIVASGCGPALRLNVLTKITAPSTLATGALLPGETIADPDLQNAAQFYALKAAGGLPKTCPEAYVANTAFIGFAPTAQPLNAASENITPWREVWTLDLCRVVKRVTLDFVPSPQGVSVAAKLGG
jgi:hypothetical protein